MYKMHIMNKLQTANLIPSNDDMMYNHKPNRILDAGGK